MNSDPRKITISRQNVVDHMAQFLYTMGAVPHSADITNIKFSNLDKELVEIEVYAREEVEVFRLK